MINYKHLHYFVSIARSGGVIRAAERLHLTPQTLSGQLSQFEERLGVALFRRVGRRLELTATGKLALSYAEEIFQTGAELEDLLKMAPRNASSPSASASPTSCRNSSPIACLRRCWDFPRQCAWSVRRTGWNACWPIWRSTVSTWCWPTAPCRRARRSGATAIRSGNPG